MKRLLRRLEVMLLFLVPILAPSVGATVLDEIKPGAFGLELHTQLGQPYKVNEEKGGWNECFRCKKKGLSEVTAWYTDQGFVRWTRLRLVNELPPEGAKLLFDLHSGRTLSEGHAFATCALEGGRTAHYIEDGVHLFVHEEVVREIWLTQPEADLEAIRKTCKIVYDPNGLIEDDAQPLNLSYDDEDEMDRPLEPIRKELPQPVPQKPTAQLPMRQMNIERLWYTFELSKNFYPVIKLHATVKTANLKDKSILFRGFIHRPGTREPLKAAANAPKEVTLRSGVFCPQRRSTVKYDRSRWKRLTLAFPLEHTENVEKVGGRYVLTMQAYCDKMMCACETECCIPSQSEADLTAEKTVSVGEISFEEAEIPGRGKGFWAKAPVRVSNCQGETLTCTVTLHQGLGNWVKVAFPTASTEKEKVSPYVSVSREKVPDADSRWDAFRIFVPYRMLDLPAGAARRVTVRFAAQCGPGVAAAEKDRLIPLP